MREKGEGGSDSGLEGGAGWSERRRPGLPRGMLTGAWPPHGVRALARSGIGAANGQDAALKQAGPAYAARPEGR